MKIMVYIRRFRLCFLIVGGLCLSYGIYQKCWYADPLEKALESIEANRLDQQYLETAKDSLFSLKALTPSWKSSECRHRWKLALSRAICASRELVVP